MTKPDTIAAEDVKWQESVEEHGFVMIPSVHKAEKIGALRESLANQEQHRSRAGVRHLLSNPTVAELANDPRLLGIAQSVLGLDAFPFRATLFDKSSDANWLITWHQDTALPLRDKQETPGWGPWSTKQGIIYAHAPASVLERVVALRLHLDDSDQENGPLRVIPGSHRQGVLSDQQIETIVGKIRACNVPDRARRCHCDAPSHHSRIFEIPIGQASPRASH